MVFIPGQPIVDDDDLLKPRYLPLARTPDFTGLAEAPQPLTKQPAQPAAPLTQPVEPLGQRTYKPEDVLSGTAAAPQFREYRNPHVSFGRKLGAGLLGGLVGLNNPQAGSELAFDIAQHKPLEQFRQDTSAYQGALEQGKLGEAEREAKEKTLEGQQRGQEEAAKAALENKQAAELEQVPYEIPGQPGQEPIMMSKKDRDRLLGIGQQQAGADTRNQSNIASREKIATDREKSQERIAQTNNDLKRIIAGEQIASREKVAGENLQERQTEFAQKQEGPTTQDRNMAHMAQTVQDHIPAIEEEVDSLATSIGPAVGRWNELMVNKGGTDFPEFADLDTTLDLFASAIVRTHFGARGGQEYRQALRKMFSEAQTPEDLKARIRGAGRWIDAYAGMAPRIGGEKGAGGGPPKGASDEVYGKDGKTLIGHVVNGKFVALSK